MSRELKFRLYSKLAKKYIDYLTIGFSKTGELRSYSTENGVGPVLADNYIVEQSTGLKDKNGKEIHEGDIVYVVGKGIAQVIDSPSGEWMLYYRPEPNEINSNLAGVVPKNKPNGLWKTNTTNYIEVIDNIHKNKELLGDDDD